MWEYEKRLQYPVKIARPDARAAKVILSQYGGPNINCLREVAFIAKRYI